MNQPENLSSEPLDSLILLAESGTDEDWDKIDAYLSGHSDDPELAAWARENTANADEGLRDLAASIFEVSSAQLSGSDIALLQSLMADSSYPGFRAACALAKRIEQEEVQTMKEEIRAKLEQFMGDADVAEIAQGYLTTL